MSTTMIKRVLVVDDHPVVALALKAILRKRGSYEVGGSALSAADGLTRLAAGHRYDAVLLDLHLPDMGGPELMQAFRARDPHVPLILHSAADETAEIDAVRGLVDAIALKSRVDQVIDALDRLTDP